MQRSPQTAHAGLAPALAGSAGGAEEFIGLHQAFDRFWRWMIRDEIPNAAGFLSGSELDSFLSYYDSLPSPDEEGGIRRYLRGCWRTEAGWASRWIAERLAADPDAPVRVLDAGSGFGTYSMLFSALGAVVTGADLRPDRLGAAGRRALFYRFRTGRPARVQFQRADLTSDWGAHYDLVWVYNALSHIEPLEEFLAAARRHLNPHGVMVIGDINGGHPEHIRRLARLRTQVHSNYVAPDGRSHQYAIERAFPPGQLRSAMERAGFRLVHHEMFWGGVSVLPGPVHEAVLSPIQRVWWLGAARARRQLLVVTPA